MNVYAMNLQMLTTEAILILFIWFLFNFFHDKREYFRKAFQIINKLFYPIAVYIVLRYSVLERTPSDERLFTFFADYGNEFYRELFMNALLYIPVGMVFSVWIGPWAILIGFVMSIAIESWQFFNGTGLAQGTDVIMNTLGTAIGSLPWMAACLIKRMRR